MTQLGSRPVGGGEEVGWGGGRLAAAGFHHVPRTKTEPVSASRTPPSMCGACRSRSACGSPTPRRSCSLPLAPSCPCPGWRVVLTRLFRFAGDFPRSSVGPTAGPSGARPQTPPTSLPPHLLNPLSNKLPLPHNLPPLKVPVLGGGILGRTNKVLSFQKEKNSQQRGSCGTIQIMYPLLGVLFFFGLIHFINQAP